MTGDDPGIAPKDRPTRRRLLMLAAAVAGLAFATRASLADDDDDDDDDHDEARDAVRRGDALPLERILPVVKQAVPGKILGLKSDSDDGRLLYEFKVLTPEGAYYEIEVDARTGKVLEIERK